MPDLSTWPQDAIEILYVAYRKLHDLDPTDKAVAHYHTELEYELHDRRHDPAQTDMLRERRNLLNGHAHTLAGSA